MSDFPSGWWHLAVTINNSLATIYINGDETVSTSLTPGSNGGTYAETIGNIYRIGGGSVGPYNFSPFTMYRARISDSLKYTANFLPEVDLTIDSDTIALWGANSGQGTTLPDLSGYGHDGTINGATWVNDCP